MIGDIGWSLIALAAVLVELNARRPIAKTARFGELAARWGRTHLGTWLMWVVWLFFGVHLFSRLGIRP